MLERHLEPMISLSSIKILVFFLDFTLRKTLLLFQVDKHPYKRV